MIWRNIKKGDIMNIEMTPDNIRVIYGELVETMETADMKYLQVKIK